MLEEERKELQLKLENALTRTRVYEVKVKSYQEQGIDEIIIFYSEIIGGAKYRHFSWLQLEDWKRKNAK